MATTTILPSSFVPSNYGYITTNSAQGTTGIWSNPNGTNYMPIGSYGGGGTYYKAYFKVEGYPPNVVDPSSSININNITLTFNTISGATSSAIVDIGIMTSQPTTGVYYGSSELTIIAKRRTITASQPNTITITASQWGSLGGSKYIVFVPAETSAGGATNNNAGVVQLTPSTLKINLTWSYKTYSVEYNANGGSGTTATQTKTHGTNLVLRNNTFTPPANYTVNGAVVSRSGNGGTSLSNITIKDIYSYSFVQWRLNSATGTAYAAGADYSTNAAATFYAEWTGNRQDYGATVLGTTTRADKTENYTVTYNANGGTCDVFSDKATKTTKYTFKGWDTNSSITTPTYNGTTSYSFSQDTNLHAIWSSSSSTSSVTLPEPSRKGYTFKGWSASKTATSGTAAGKTYTPTKNTTLYAIWSANNYTVTLNPSPGKFYDLQGEEITTPMTFSVTYDDPYGIDLQTIPIYGTKEFSHWIDEGGSTILTTSIVKTARDHELKAVYSGINLQIQQYIYYNGHWVKVRFI